VLDRVGAFDAETEPFVEPPCRIVDQHVQAERPARRGRLRLQRAQDAGADSAPLLHGREIELMQLDGAGAVEHMQPAANGATGDDHLHAAAPQRAFDDFALAIRAPRHQGLGARPHELFVEAPRELDIARLRRP